MNVSAVLVTRGDVDMEPILASLPYDDVVVWDNSERENSGIYGRYLAIAEAKHDVIYTQDDDLIFRHHAELQAAYKPGVMVVNRPSPYDIPWQGGGALFRRDLPQRAFERYWAKFPHDHYFRFFACDGIFALLTEHEAVDLGWENREFADAPGRVSTSPGWWGGKRDEIQNRCAQLLG